MTPIIVINWNGIEDTKECISSILHHTEASFKIILIDNGSSNNEGESLSEIYSPNPKIEVIRYLENHGFTGAHNKIWEEKLHEANKSKFIILLNNDTIVTKGWLNHMIKEANASGAMLVVPLMLDYYNRRIVDNFGLTLLSSGEIIPLHSGSDISNLQQNIKQIGACGGACLISTRLLIKNGFFDSHFSTGYEDAEFGLKTIVTSNKISSTKDSIVLHKGGRSIKKIFNKQYVIRTQRNILYTIIKLYPTYALITLFPFVLLRYLFQIVVSLVFIKWNYLKLLVISLYRFFRYDFSKALNSRKTVIAKNKIGLYRFIQLQKSSILYDLKRFYKYFILRQSSALDKYR